MSELYDRVSRLTAAIFSRESDRLFRTEQELVAKNATLCEAPDGFKFMGVYYSNLEPRLRKKGHKGPLHESLVGPMEDHLADKARVELEKLQAGQALTLLLRDCKTPQDVRDALPNCLQGCLPEIRGLSRTREEAYTLKGEGPIQERARRQYLKLRELLEFYSMAGLFY